MPIHDEYARVTPFELAFPSREEAERHLAAISEEVGAGAELPDLLSARSVRAAVAELHAPEAGPGGTEAGANFGMLLYHLLHFRDAGYPLFLAETGAVRSWVARSPSECPPRFEPDPPAGYLQLPRPLVWIRGVESDPDGADVPVTVDGIFWSPSERGTHLLIVGGIAPQRPGLTAVPIPPIAPETWISLVDEPMREQGEDFTSTLPGAELEGLYEIHTPGEAVKLFLRSMIDLRSRGEELSIRHPLPEASGGIPVSDFPYRAFEAASGREVSGGA